MTQDTLLLRQVNPAWIQQGRVTSQVFRPTPKDNKALSVYDGSLISAEKAWLHFTERLSFKSIGVVAVTVQECELHDLQARPEPAPFPEHAIIDFSKHGEKEIYCKAVVLRTLAQARGWQYRSGE